jgi:glycosyltransferase involved in cell wall biosynthesis
MVREWSRRGEIDFVEAPDWAGWTAGWRGLGVPVIIRLHGSASYFAAEMGHDTPRILGWLERTAVRGADFRCSVSHYTARRTAALFALRELDPVLYNPVELPNHRASGPRSRHRVVFSGTLTRKKGIGTLMQAWPSVVAAVPEAELHVYGKSVAWEGAGAMTAAALEAPFRGASVVWHGHVPRPRLLEALGEARVAVFPSYAEAFAMAPLEAMACGCPTIYTRRGSGPELAEDGREVVLVDPDDPGEVARAIIRLLRDDVFASHLGAAGQALVRLRYSLESLIRENETFYHECLNGRRDVGIDHRLHLSSR